MLGFKMEYNEREKGNENYIVKFRYTNSLIGISSLFRKNEIYT